MRKLAVAAVAFVLVGCGGDESESPIEDVSTEGQVEVRIDKSPPKSEKTAKPKPERTVKPRPQRSDKEIFAARRYFTKMDDLAIALDEAVDGALDGEPVATTRVGELRDQILDTVSEALLNGADTSIGGNLLLSAATQARDAAAAGNLPRMVDARRDIADARLKLADEVVNG